MKTQNKTVNYLIITLVHSCIAVFLIGGFLPIVARAVGGASIMIAVGVYLLLGVFVPVAWMFAFHGKLPDGAAVTWKTVALCPLPLTLIVSAMLIFMPEGRSALEASLSQAIYDYFEFFLSQLDGMSMGASMSAVLEHRDEIVRSTLIYAPAIIYTTLALVFYFTERILYRPSSRDVIPLPDAFLAFLILFGVCMVLPLDGSRVVGLNGLLCTGMLYFLRGMDITRYFFTSWRMHPVVRGIMYFFILITQPFIIGVALLGFISIYKNFIREEPGNGSKA